ncbi:MAG: cell wall hydrolase, partial [Sphingomonas sp.]
MTIGIASFLSASTPGFAAQLDQTINARANVTVPRTGPAPAVLTMVQPLPGDLQSVSPAATDSAAQPSPDSYDTLDAAVAAQRDASATSDELTCLAGAIYFESKGEPLN